MTPVTQRGKKGFEVENNRREDTLMLDAFGDPLIGARVLLVHQWLYTWAGAERVLEQLAHLLPHADVLAGMVTAEMRHNHPIAARAMESWAGRLPLARTQHRWLLPAHALALGTFDTSEYDLIISVSHAFEKFIRASKRGAVHLSYCLTPPRYLWDLSESHDAMATSAQRLALRVARRPFRALDHRAARRVDRFVCLSKHVADRVRRAYGRESAVVYPPVTAKEVSVSSGRERFLLSLGRLVPYKRVDLAIGAAEQLGMRLVVAGEGPERSRLQRLAGRHIEFVGHVPEHEAGELLSRCAALVFCAEEDFGITPVEAMAHGAPVVAYARGGAMETLSDGTTGTLFNAQSVEAVVAAITRCLARTWNEAVLRTQADRFSPEHFRSGMREQILQALSTGGANE